MIEIEKNPLLPDYDEEVNVDIESQSVNEYISIFVSNNERAKSLDTSRTLLYRGQANKGWGLTPSIFNKKGYLQDEHTMIKKLLLSAATDFAEIKNPFERLVKMQHYGLPTRLLDVTTNPLVALYFACIDCPDKDGEIFVFYDFLHGHGELNVRILSALAEYHGKSEQGFLNFLSEYEFPVTKVSISDLLIISHILVEPPMNNERIKRQCGAFAIVGIRQNTNSYEKECHNLRDLIVVKENEGIERSIIIPKESKEQLLIELDVLGINKAFLFPELEHQTAYLKSKYEVK